MHETSILVGLEGDELQIARSLTGRRGAQHDIAATTMGLLAMPPAACDQGLILLADPETWPEDRIVYSVGGEDLFDPNDPEHAALAAALESYHARLVEAFDRERKPDMGVEQELELLRSLGYVR